MPETIDQKNAIPRWRNFMTSLGFHDFVSPEYGFILCSNVNWRNANSAGIYCWFAENGEAYVGQAKIARRRLLDHWKANKDILAAAFMQIDIASLNAKERELIKKVENFYPTRNIKHAISTAAFVPLDAIVTERDREHFLRDTQLIGPFDWRSLEILEKKQASKFRRLENLAEYNLILFALRKYVSACLPHPARTENRFWSVTLYPDAANLLRVNAGQQEISTIAKDADALYLRVLADEKFDETARQSTHSTRAFVHYLLPNRIAEWLTADHILACRRLILWLMRHTTTLNNGSHCPQVVRACFASKFEPVIHRPFAPARPIKKARRL
jgi:hypothetical protein